MNKIHGRLTLPQLERARTYPNLFLSFELGSTMIDETTCKRALFVDLITCMDEKKDQRH